MDMEDYFQETMLHPEMVDTDEKLWQKSVSASSAKDPDYTDDGFQCNICLDHAHEPVVTLCGHLYCWPCIYKWIHFQSSSTTSDQQPQCPVCKADVSQSLLVPLYGRGHSFPQSEPNGKESSPALEIPSRPRAAQGVHTMITTTPSNGGPFPLQSQFQSNQHQQYYPEFYDNASASRPATMTTTVHPMVGMFGEMVYARIFGNGSEMGWFVHPNSYHLMGNSSARVRRQEMKAEKSLNRISIFLFCCLVLCLLSF
ncbi:zinc finger protein [Macleaya cordata]|uniref:E3 ubiquitin-protein ligase RMA n=1 Tax=Macleaya cordata TaxID=56857 RepID=A0A200QWU4_MACCD|nr:zinc finger protein [Macleaya cordata]